jgi:hypothetical protein
VTNQLWREEHECSQRTILLRGGALVGVGYSLLETKQGGSIFSVTNAILIPSQWTTDTTRNNERIFCNYRSVLLIHWKTFWRKLSKHFGYLCKKSAKMWPLIKFFSCTCSVPPSPFFFFQLAQIKLCKRKSFFSYSFINLKLVKAMPSRILAKK